MRLQEEQIKRIINEEMSRSDVRNVVSSELSSYTKSREFEEAVKKLTSDVFERFFKLLYDRRGMWKNEIKR